MLSENRIELSGIKNKEEEFSKSKGGNVYLLLSLQQIQM